MARRKHKPPSPKSQAQGLSPGPVADVIEMLGVEAIIRPCEGGEPERALLARQVSKRSAVVVGDRVQCGILEQTDAGGSDEVRLMITRVEPRRNVLVKPDFHGRSQAIASNLDHIVVVVTPRDPPLRLGLIDRYLAAASLAGISPVICLNKAELDDEGEAQAQMAVYGALGIQVAATTARGEVSGIAELMAILAGRRSVLVGHSGVGKSSLACALIPGLERRVGEVNEVIGRGRHTTTTASLLALPGGGELVDTPGVRAFGLFGISAEALAGLYPEFVSRADDCHFRACSHIHEPRCAVRAAVDDAEIDEGRYERYLSIYETLPSG